MARNRRRTPRTYTDEEKIALVTEIERRYRAGDGPVSAIARELGTSDTNYYNWVRKGIQPRAAEPERPARPVAARPYAEADRTQLLAEVDDQRAKGLSVKAACRCVGIAEKSYRKWREADAPLPAMRPVEVTAPAPEVTALVPVAIDAPASLFEPVSPTAPPRPAPEPPGLSLVAPGGYRLEGLAVETAVAVLRALAC